MSKIFFLFSGGTGGHVIPAVNFGNYLISRGYDCILLLDHRGNAYSYNFKGRICLLHSAHFSGGILFKIISILKLLIGLIQSIFFLIKYRPIHCVSFGSYASFAPLLATIIMKLIRKIDIHVHEQNSIMGRVNLFFLRFTKNIFINFDNIYNLKKNLYKKTLHVGMPSKCNNRTKTIQKNRNNKKISIFLYGGSQGSIPIVNCFLLMIQKFDKKYFHKIKLFIQCPNNISGNLSKKLNELKIDYKIKDYYKNLNELLQFTDIVISRSGAGTINDIINYNIPSILFPLPHSKDNHQISNAQYLADKKVAIVMNEINFNDELGYKHLKELIDNNQIRISMRRTLEHINILDANNLMLKKILI